MHLRSGLRYDDQWFLPGVDMATPLPFMTEAARVRVEAVLAELEEHSEGRLCSGRFLGDPACVECMALWIQLDWAERRGGGPGTPWNLPFRLFHD